MHKHLIAALLAGAFTLPAHALLVDDASLLPGPTTSIDFEAYDGFITTGPEAVSADVIFTGDTDSQLGAFIAELGTNGLWGAGNKFVATEFFGELRFTFSDGQLSQGGGAFVNHFANDVLPFAVQVSAYGENNEIIETHRLTIDTPADSLNAGLFVGIVRPTADIRSISFKGVTVLDDFAYTAPVPEPGTWAMMAAGLALMGNIARRRRG
jgi:PEP-CTERM motif